MAYSNSTTAQGSSTTPAVAVPSGVSANIIVLLQLNCDAATYQNPIASLGTVGTQGKFPSGFVILGEGTTTTVDGSRSGWAWKRATGNDSGSYTMSSAVNGAAVPYVMQSFIFSGRRLALLLLEPSHLLGSQCKPCQL